MVARMMRFYHLSDCEVLEMPVQRFFAIHRKIVRLEAEEEARQLIITHSSKPGERLQELTIRMGGKKTTDIAQTASAVNDGAGSYTDANSILAERERQKQNAKKLKDAWEQKQRERLQPPPPESQ